MRNLILTCFLSLGVFAIVSGQDAQFSIAVSNDSILLGNHFEVTFTMENTNGRNFQTPDFKGFQIVGGPSQSSQMSIINGEMTQKKSWTYYLEPSDIGNYYIEPASIETDDGILETAPIEVLVVPNPDGVIQKSPSKEPSNQEWNLFGDPFQDRKRQPERVPKKPKKKRKVYRI